MSSTTANTPARLGSGAMFDSIAERYDLLNRLMSMGLDQGWRRKAVASLNVPENGRVLDLATGTADLAIRIARTHPTATVVGIDPSEGMLNVGREKVAGLDLGARVDLQVGDAQFLNLEDDAFDGVTIAFGIRNVPDRVKALREMARVVRPGGRIAVLELSAPKTGLTAMAVRFQIRFVVPIIGRLLSGATAYGYLRDSVEAFPPPDDFGATMESAGLRMVKTHRLGLGACALFVAEVPE
jgi:demethylmenaquinone methyltransferase/2-methoxy-6-polyprenyl-1,4-benzoquinol methylase